MSSTMQHCAIERQSAVMAAAEMNRLMMKLLALYSQRERLNTDEARDIISSLPQALEHERREGENTISALTQGNLRIHALGWDVG